MDYYEVITLRNGKECCLRSANESDGAAVLENFLLTHEETDNLLSYPDENTFSAKKEGELLRKKAESEKEIEIIAVIDGKVAGSAGINAIGRYHKVRHRAEFGISIAKEYWGLGIGGKLTNA